MKAAEAEAIILWAAMRRAVIFKGGLIEMYEKHEMVVVRYRENDFVITSGVDEGGTRTEDEDF